MLFLSEVESVKEITRIKNGAGTGGWVECKCRRRDINNSPANLNSNQVNIVK